jgi:hypothetical protein
MRSNPTDGGHSQRHTVTVIAKSSCHICENVIEDLQKLSEKYPFQLETLDIMNDAALFDKYWLKIPVVRLDGIDVLEVEQIAFPNERMRKLEAILSATLE